jgi:hypothetical protein
MNIVKGIKYNPNCIASITVKAKGRNAIRLDKIGKSNTKTQKKQISSC